MTIDSYAVPPPLTKGSTIGVCAPSSVFDRSQFNKGIKVLESMGFNIYIPSAVYKRKRYMAGDERLRANVINTLFQNSEIDGIICARGGFGAIRILDYINYDLIARHPKLFVGFSDATSLLVAISQRSMIQVVHGPVVTSLADADTSTLESLYKQLLFSHSYMVSTPYHTPFNFAELRILREGIVEGRLTGGNLATLCHLTGTRFQPELNGTVLFVEDVAEPPYKIDRMLTQMKLAGMLKGVKGVIAGTFERCKDKESGDQKVIDEILLEIFDKSGQPIIAGLNSGHGKTNLSLRFGAYIKLNTETQSIMFL